jgi:hypothetical protein
MADEERRDLVAQLVGGPLDGRVQAVRAPKLLFPLTDSSIWAWLESSDSTAPPRWCYAAYEIEAPDSPADDRTTRYTFRGFE